MNKVCSRCKIPKPLYEYKKKTVCTKTETKRAPHPQCIQCEYELGAESRRAKNDYLKMLLLERNAMICEVYVSTGHTQNRLQSLFECSYWDIQKVLNAYFKTPKIYDNELDYD